MLHHRRRHHVGKYTTHLSSIGNEQKWVKHRTMRNTAGQDGVKSLVTSDRDRLRVMIKIRLKPRR